MPTKQELTIHGVKVLRPEPTKRDSLRCRLGFHDMVQFAIEGNFILGRFPEYCTRCNEYTSGMKIPPRPKMPKMPKVKPVESDPRTRLIQHATKLLQDEGYLVAHNLETAAEMLICRGYKVLRPSELAKGGEIKSVETYTVGENGPRTHQFLSPDNKVHTVKHPPHLEESFVYVKQDRLYDVHERQMTHGYQPNSTKEPTPPGDE
ncbi:hypothetical protein VPHK404_0008 [Vibrio phage K404]